MRQPPSNPPSNPHYTPLELSHEHPDALIQGPQRGRGAALNPANRFESLRLHVLGEHLDEQQHKPAQQTKTQILTDTSRTILNYVDPKTSPDIGFEWTVNPYRGCEHGCVYCYARPGHEFLGMSCGLDFETKIVAKHDAPAILRRELTSPKWRPQTVVMSGVTDPYQPIEEKLRITRGCLQVFAQMLHPVSLITKNKLILRDLDLLQTLAKHHASRAAISITTLRNDLASKMEPRASSPRDRIDTIRKLASAGIPVAVMVAPVIPGLNDAELPAILRAASDAGAQSAGYILLRLPHQLKAIVIEWLVRHFPDRAARVESLLRQSRDGQLYDARPRIRQSGVGPIANQIGEVFHLFARRYNLDRDLPDLNTNAFCPPMIGHQPALFE